MKYLHVKLRRLDPSMDLMANHECLSVCVCVCVCVCVGVRVHTHVRVGEEDISNRRTEKRNGNILSEVIKS